MASRFLNRSDLIKLSDFFPIITVCLITNWRDYLFFRIEFNPLVLSPVLNEVAISYDCVSEIKVFKMSSKNDRQGVIGFKNVL